MVKNSKRTASRVCKYTYGIAHMMTFKPHHALSKRVTIKGVDFCDEIFYKHIEIRTTKNVADAESVEAYAYFPSHSDIRVPWMKKNASL